MEKLVLRCGVSIQPFFSRNISCILFVDNHLSSPGPVECKKQFARGSTCDWGLKQLMCAKKGFQGSSVVDCATHFNIPIILLWQLDPLLAADSGYSHIAASGKPKVYKLCQPFLKVEDVETPDLHSSSLATAK